ncbi:MAG: hypothetical protein F4039_07565 [Gammaproteobacteria bacterium]|nr:hypothetical protein [Gammaproteobacteria bacterium]MYF54014.1 hypothetical protein [Gammaproteobacteria bacterium]MYK43927.1 hypothetical protein [Gammaproteobacteria bacterium]
MNTKQSTSRVIPDLFSVIFGVVLATLVLSVVYFFSPLNKSATQADSITAENSTKSVSRNPDSAKTTQNPVDSLQEIGSLSDILELYATSFDRYLAIYHLCGPANELELEEFLKQAVELTTDESTEFWGQHFAGVILYRLVQSNSDRTQVLFAELDEATQSQVAYYIANEWATFDSEGAESFVAGLSDTPRYSAARGVIDAQRMLSTNELITLGETLEVSEYVEDVLTRMQFYEDKQNPEAAWQEISTDPELLGTDNYSRLLRIVEAWTRKSGLYVLDNVLEKLPDEGMKQPIVTRVLEIHAKTDPDAAFDYAVVNKGGRLGFNYDLFSIVDVWSKSNPSAAVDRISALDGDMQKQSLLDAVFRNMAEDDLDSMIEEIHRFPEGVRDSARSEAIESLMKENELEVALAIFAEIESDEMKQDAAYDIAEDWVDSDPKAAIDWVLNEPATESIRPMLSAMTLGRIAESDPEGAFEIARNQPLIGENSVGTEASVLEWISMRDVEAALKLLPKVREGKTKERAYVSVGSALAREGRLSESIELANDLPVERHDSYYTAVGTTAVTLGGMRSDSNTSIFDTLDLLPSETARSKTASSAILRNSFSKKYSDEEIETLKGYLTEEDLKDLEEREDRLDSFPMPLFGF